MVFLFRLLLTFNATSLLLIVYFVQKGYVPSTLFPEISLLQKIPNLAFYFFYSLIPLILTGLSIILARRLPRRNVGDDGVIAIGHANNSFLPSYLGYFFVALSVGSMEALIYVYTVLFIFTFLSQALYFNPLFLIYGYQFYNIKTVNGSEIFLISKKSFKSPAVVRVDTAYAINDYTFMDGDEK